MITIQNLNLQYGKKLIFKDISARINEQDRIGLVGVNGAGKSTLMKMICGQADTDPGVITTSKLATLGYLPQEVEKFEAGRSVLEEAETAFAELLALNDKLKEINHELSRTQPQSSHFSTLLKMQGELQVQLDESDFFEIRAKTEKVLTGLGFREKDFHQDCHKFSGGWLMRLMLAKLLLRHPSFLFLDEPTNHLDIESLTWLEDFLKNYQGALIIISHDRTFLDNLTDQTWELSLGNLTCYRGNYSKYTEEKALRMQIQKAAFDNQQAKIQQTMRFVNRFRAKSTKAKQVQSRLKQLEKMDIIELESDEKSITFHFPPALPCGRTAVSAEDLAKSYGDNHVFQHVRFDLQKGDKVAVVGVNGAGKSTLVKILADQLTPSKGQMRLGHNVKPTYFGQHQAQDLPQNFTVLQTLETVESELTTTQMRSLLGAFLFQGEDVDKKVMVLSGGEKSRLALARMIAEPSNLLIMDEPTNHLDLSSQAILQEALRQYDGSIIVVSHNRSFLDSFVNRVLEVKNGEVTLHEGNLSLYLEGMKKQASASTPTNSAQPGNDLPSGGTDTPTKARGKEARREQAKIRQEKSKLLKPLQEQLDDFESTIEALETEKSLLEQELSEPELYQDLDAFAEKSQQYKKVEKRLGDLMHKWEEIQEKIDAVEERFQE